MKQLSANRMFCLRSIARRDTSTWEVCKEARDAGLNLRQSGMYEWADAPFRYLREAGLIERTDRRDAYERKIHAITEAGRAAISEDTGNAP